MNPLMMTAPFWQAVDEKILRWLHGCAHPVLDEIVKAVTQGGSGLALTTVTAVCALVLWQRYQRRHAAAVYALAALTSFMLNGALKRWFERPRPQLWQQIIPLPRDASFPSGHAMISMTVYGLAAWFLVEHFPQWRKAILSAAGLLILLIGGSRNYLGVHWPSDVLAGFICGFVIVAASALWHRRSFATQINVTQDE